MYLFLKNVDTNLEWERVFAMRTITAGGRPAREAH